MKNIHLQLDQLIVGYNGKALIHGIEIGVQRGEIVTLVGPNGSGKSTILKTITRQLIPVGGDIFLAEGGADDAGSDGHVKKLEQFAPGDLARNMAVMLTGRLQTELMTCRDVAAMGRYPYTGRLGILSEEDEQKVEEALAAVHAQHLSDRPFDAVSDGERQRILLARAICQEPQIIVLDEPTSYLDIRHKLELLSILYKMSREQGITVVMSLHEIDLAMKISDRVICVRGEEIFACGKPSEILNDETVRKLYDLDPELGRFDADNGSLELYFAEKNTSSQAEMLSAKSAPRQAEFKGNIPAVESSSEQSSSQAELPSAKSSPQAEPPSAKEYPQAEKNAIPIPRFMIAAPGSGSGKTLITCGLLRLLQRKHMRPTAFKCGPDYIDPMFHRQVLGIPSRNLDTFFSPADSDNPANTARATLARAVHKNRADIAVIEGVMGYFDGTGTSGMDASSFDLAQQTDTPVILVINAKGMSRSVVPLLKGFADYEKENRRIRGVILNRVSAGMFPMMKKWIEEDTGLKVIGYLSQDDSISWGSRHLGLMQPEELSDLQEQINHLADILEETIDRDALLEIAGTAPALSVCAKDTESVNGFNYFAAQAQHTLESMQAIRTISPRIAVARDEAFSFYYEDNLEMLQECGAELVFFSPIHDWEFPAADGLVLGGGYPELYAQALAENEAMKTQIRECAAKGMPILAECGGFMYLQESLEIRNNKETDSSADTIFKMCGVLPGSCRMTDRLVRFGYIELEKKDGEEGQSGYLQDGHRIRGHEFHYFDSTENGEACTAHKPGRRRSWNCMVVQGNVMAGFPHLYYRSDPDFAAAFVEKCSQLPTGTKKWIN